MGQMMGSEHECGSDFDMAIATLSFSTAWSPGHRSNGLSYPPILLFCVYWNLIRNMPWIIERHQLGTDSNG